MPQQAKLNEKGCKADKSSAKINIVRKKRKKKKFVSEWVACCRSDLYAVEYNFR